LRAVRRDSLGVVPHRPVVRLRRWRALISVSIFLLVFSRVPIARSENQTITLDEAYTRARTRSAEILAARERIVEAEINLDRAWALLKPTWNASFTFTHTEPQPPPFRFPDLASDAIRMSCASDGMGGVVDLPGCGAALAEAVREPRELDFFEQNTAAFNSVVTWNVFNGRAFPLIANARDAIALEGSRHTGMVLDLLLAVARAYYAAAASKEAIAAADRAHERAKSELAIAEKQLELGETVRARLSAAKSALAQADLDVRRARVAHAQSLLTLHALTRSEDDRPGVVAPPSPERPSGDARALIEQAYEARDEVRSAAIAVDIAERGDDEAWWRFAPTLSLFAGFRYSNVGGLSQQNEQWSAGINATMLLYDGGLRYADLRSAGAQLRAARLTFEGARARVKTEVERAELSLESAELSVARAREALVLAQERASVMAAQYDVGALRTIELQQASDAVLDAEIAIIRAEMERSLAILELQRAVGAFKP
jgi:outer membrane protein TolC